MELDQPVASLRRRENVRVVRRRHDLDLLDEPVAKKAPCVFLRDVPGAELRDQMEHGRVTPDDPPARAKLVREDRGAERTEITLRNRTQSDRTADSTIPQG